MCLTAQSMVSSARSLRARRSRLRASPRDPRLDTNNGYEIMRRMSSKLFQKKLGADKRTIHYPILLTEKEDVAIRLAAAIRKISVAEYFRRTALGRRADVRYEMDIVLKLSEVVKTIRTLHADLERIGVEPAAEGFRQVILDARDAILRIQK